MTAEERTGWRDEALSRRHRKWGLNCPAEDIDFILIEYDNATPVAIVEYKHWQAKPVDLNEANYKALRRMADKCELPLIVAKYWPDTWAFRVQPVNDLAKRIYHDNVGLTEQRYVESLYFIRGRLNDPFFRRALLNNIPPPDEP